VDQQKKAVWGWALYDWANSAFATTVMSGFFPIFFKQFWSLGADPQLTTARLGLANSAGSLLVALLAPILGAIADRGSLRKHLLILLAYLGVLSTAALYLVGQGQWGWAVLLYVVGNIGFAGANVFYDSLLPTVASEDRIDFVSGLGFSLGYLGGGLLFGLNVLMTLKPAWFGLADAAMAVRISFLTVALWWGGFTLITIFWVPRGPAAGGGAADGSMVAAGFKQLAATLKKARHMKTIGLFLAAYWFYIDGVDTIIRMAVDYGITLGFKSSDLILALLIVQFVGFPAALAFGRLGQRWGVKKAIFLAIGVYMVITAWGMSVTRVYEFYLLAGGIGLVQGGIQALSRSYYSRLIPAGQSAEYYGFYNLLGKFAVILGPLLMAGVGLWARRLLMPPAATPEQVLQVGRLAARYSLGSVLILFVIGAVLLLLVDEKKGRAQAKALSE